ALIRTIAPTTHGGFAYTDRAHPARRPPARNDRRLAATGRVTESVIRRATNGSEILGYVRCGPVEHDEAEREHREHNRNHHQHTTGPEDRGGPGRSGFNHRVAELPEDRRHR